MREYITRDEYERMNTLLLDRLGHIEKLCFDDSERTSVSTLMRRLESHMTAAADYARFAKYAFALLADAIALMATYHSFIQPLM